jgi:hypothetical protein
MLREPGNGVGALSPSISLKVSNIDQTDPCCPGIIPHKLRWFSAGAQTGMRMARSGVVPAKKAEFALYRV